MHSLRLRKISRVGIDAPSYQILAAAPLPKEPRPTAVLCSVLTFYGPMNIAILIDMADIHGQYISR